MATWIVHLRIAEGLLALIPGLDAAQFSIGNIAPDGGLPNEDWSHFDPPKEVTHYLRPADAFGRNYLKINDQLFFNKYLKKVLPTEMARFSFLLGYLFHLQTDNLWRRHIWWPTKDKFQEEFKGDSLLGREVKRDWYGLDIAYVRKHPDSLFWKVFVQAEYTQNYLDHFPDEAIPKQLAYIKEFYQRRDPQLEEAYRLNNNIYLTEVEVAAFVDLSIKQLFSIYQKLYIENIDIPEGAESALDLN